MSELEEQLKQEIRKLEIQNLSLSQQNVTLATDFGRMERLCNAQGQLAYNLENELKRLQEAKK